MQRFRSSGKLLISGEYLVLKGAKALALPTKFGQEMKVSYMPTSSQEKLIWEALDHQKNTWFNAEYSLPDLRLLSFTDEFKAKQLLSLLHLCFKTNIKLFKAKQHIHITTHLEFPNDWGLGSSSTLICNLAKWSGTNAFDLLKSISKGSGYDVAVGLESKPLIYQIKDDKPTWKVVNFSPNFSENIFFIHLNQKQKSEIEIEKFEAKFQDDKGILQTINDSILSLINDIEISDFEYILHESENIISEVLQTPAIQKRLFTDYDKGVIKSLGAWGGDFILVTTKNKTDLDYFREKGYNTILSYDEMILT